MGHRSSVFTVSHYIWTLHYYGPNRQNAVATCTSTNKSMTHDISLRLRVRFNDFPSSIRKPLVKIFHPPKYPKIHRNYPKIPFTQPITGYVADFPGQVRKSLNRVKQVVVNKSSEPRTSYCTCTRHDDNGRTRRPLFRVPYMNFWANVHECSGGFAANVGFSGPNTGILGIKLFN